MLMKLSSKVQVAALSALLIGISPRLVFSFMMEKRINEWRAIAQPVDAAPPSFIKRLNITSEHLEGFLRVMARTQLEPQAELSDVQIKEAVEIYILDLGQRVQSALQQVPIREAGDTGWGLHAELLDLPILLSIAHEQASKVQSDAAHLEPGGQAAFLHAAMHDATVLSGSGRDIETSNVAIAPSVADPHRDFLSDPTAKKHPLKRCEEFIARTGRLPSAGEDVGANLYWRRRAKRPEKEWPPEMSDLFRKLLRESLVPPNPLASCNRIVEQTGKLPDEEQDPKAFWYWTKLAQQPETEWPHGMNDLFKELLRKEAAERASMEGLPTLARCNRFVENKGRLPTANEDKGAYSYWYRLATKVDEAQWPSEMNDFFRSSLHNKKREWTLADRPVVRCNRIVEETGKLPTISEDEGAYWYWMEHVKEPKAKWDKQMSASFRTLLLEVLKKRAAWVPHLVRCNRIVQATGKLPVQTKYKGAYNYYMGLISKPETEWPVGMSKKFRKLLREKRAKRPGADPSD